MFKFPPRINLLTFLIVKRLFEIGSLAAGLTLGGCDGCNERKPVFEGEDLVNELICDDKGPVSHPNLDRIDSHARNMGVSDPDLCREIDMHHDMVLCAVSAAKCDLPLGEIPNYGNGEISEELDCRNLEPYGGSLECARYIYEPNETDDPSLTETIYGCEWYINDAPGENNWLAQTGFWASYNDQLGKWTQGEVYSYVGATDQSPNSGMYLDYETGLVHGYVVGPLSYDIEGSEAQCEQSSIERFGEAVKALVLEAIAVK